MGNYSVMAHSMTEWRGGSPRIGELPAVAALLDRGLGMIPLYGGTTRWAVVSLRWPRGHPLVWGNYPLCSRAWWSICGASPCMGELLHRHGAADRGYRGIPLYGGTTTVGDAEREGAGGHPLVWGNYPFWAIFNIRSLGCWFSEWWSCRALLGSSALGLVSAAGVSISLGPAFGGPGWCQPLGGYGVCWAGIRLCVLGALACKHLASG